MYIDEISDEFLINGYNIDKSNIQEFRNFNKTIIKIYKAIMKEDYVYYLNLEWGKTDNFCFIVKIKEYWYYVVIYNDMGDIDYFDTIIFPDNVIYDYDKIHSLINYEVISKSLGDEFNYEILVNKLKEMGNIKEGLT